MLRFTIFFAALTYAYAVKVAVVYIFDPSGNSNVTGNVIFTNSDGRIIVSGTVSGLAAGEHGFHVHNLGDISTGCGATGPHFNPHNATHGGPDDSVRHVGDLGNIVALSSGIATVNISDSIIALEGEHSIIGRAVVVHEGKDDLGKGGNSESLATGNAGARLACGVIGIKEDSSASQMSSPLIIIASVVAFNLRSLLY